MEKLTRVLQHILSGIQLVSESKIEQQMAIFTVCRSIFKLQKMILWTDFDSSRGK
jgi:hypothetical protein